MLWYFCQFVKISVHFCHVACYLRSLWLCFSFLQILIELTVCRHNFIANPGHLSYLCLNALQNFPSFFVDLSRLLALLLLHHLEECLLVSFSNFKLLLDFVVSVFQNIECRLIYIILTVLLLILSRSAISFLSIEPGRNYFYAFCLLEEGIWEGGCLVLIYFGGAIYFGDLVVSGWR